MRFLLRLFLKVFVFFFICLVCTYAFAYISSTPELTNQNNVRLYDDEGNIFYQSNNSFQGNYVTLDSVSDDFLHAIVSIEDNRFYNHHGFDYLGIMRAVKENIQEGRLKQGASTISQQAARLLYLSNEKTWSRKIKEAYYTIKLETHFDKETILESYINNIYFGHGIYGIENAAKYFFNKSASQLDINESALLAGIINGPTYYSPLNNLENAKKRRNIVLKAMANQHHISQKDYQSLKEEKIHLASNHQIKENSSLDYYKDYVLEELNALGLSHYLKEGVDIYTAYHSSYQDELNRIIKENNSSEALQCAFVITNPKNNQIQAMIGGKDYTKSQFNRAFKASRQIGSTIKPFLYYLALEYGFTPSTTFSCKPTTFKLEDGKSYTPQNFNNHYAYQDITLAQAIAVSDNIYAMKTHLFLGSEMLSNFMNSFNCNVHNTASLALGTMQTHVLKLADMYNALAYKGRYQKSYAIVRIENKEGKILYSHKDKQEQKLNPETCLILAQLLKGTFNSSFSTYLHATMENYPIKNMACKTGSTDYDNLVVSYNKDIVVCGWSGFDDNRKIENNDDKQYVKRIVYQFLKDKKYHWYSPENIKVQKINLEGKRDDTGLVYYFKKE